MHRTATALAMVLLLLCPAGATAATEAGDAGSLPASAQDMTGLAPAVIDGSFASETDVDVYRLCLPGGGGFSASTVGGTQVDTQLWLFDANGHGVYANDDTADSSQSLLPSGHPLTPQAAGDYYLAVTSYNWDPVSAAGPIFSAAPDVLAPSEAGAADPVSGWSGRGGSTGSYRIRLEGAGCVEPDTTAPKIDLRKPLDGAIHLLGERVEADYDCFDEPGGSGLAQCAGTVADGAPVDTASVGPKQFVVEAADESGNTATARAAYRVVYDFGGFLRPVRNRPQVNRVRAGRVLPMRFTLAGYRGLDVLAPGGPQVAEVPCGSGEEPESGAPARHTPGSGLLYRKRKQRYVFRWKTQREWAGTCRQFMLKLADGTVRRADFAFKPRRGRH